MRNVALSHPVDHSTSQQHITNNRTVQNQGSVSSSTTHSNSCTHQPLLLSHCFPVPSTDSVMTNQSSSSNLNNTTIHCSMLNHPCYTTNCHHQSPLNFVYSQDNKNVTPMESENDNGFTLVKRKKKKKKIDLQQNQKSSSSSSSCSSSPTSSTNGSTSSTNTNSIINHVQPTSAVAIHLQPNSLEVNAPVSIINPFSIEISQQARQCKGSHDSNDVRCPDVKTYRAVLTKSLLAKTSTMNHQQNNQSKFHYKDQDYPSLNMNYNNNHHRINNLSNISSKRIDELYHKLSNLEGNLNRLLDLNNNYADQLTRTQQIIMNHNRDIQLKQIDGAFQRDFVSQFISPICQVMIEVISVLVKRNVLNDKTLLCPSLLALCAKLGNDLPV
ncbi:unnamed protein product [Rotaria sp. Silwood1]|nr:unnamed protein product [Rotaria sp. Silwood1]CAF4920897.1 unnamed protein product [Rotaria sp. Silwood1]